MVNQDYILRMIEQLAIFIGRAIFHRDAGRHEEAQRELDLVIRNLLGLDPEALGRGGAEGLDGLLARETDPDRLFVLGRVLAEKAEIDKARGLAAETTAREEVYAFRFLAASERGGVPRGRRVAELSKLASRLSDEALARIGGEFSGYFEDAGEYGKAEDLIFDLARLDRERAMALGRGFYERLRPKSDAELAAGKLPRDEVEEGARRLGLLPP